MTLTPPPAQPDLPPDAPSRQDGFAAFVAKANALVAWYKPFVTWLRGYIGWYSTFKTEAEALQLDVGAKAQTTSDKAAAAAASALVADAAAIAAAAATASSGAAPPFVAGTNYAAGAVAFSPITLHTYRARTGGVKNADPSQDRAAWLDLQPSAGKAYYLANL